MRGVCSAQFANPFAGACVIALLPALKSASWVLASWDDQEAVDTPTVTVTNHATLTAAQAAQKDLWEVESNLIAYLTAKAEAEVLATEAAAVASALAALLTAEGVA